MCIDAEPARRVHEIITEIDLPASAARVWVVLTDFASYRRWNPAIRSIDGVLAEGGRLRVNLRREVLQHRSPGALHALRGLAFRSWLALNGMSISVLVTKLLPERELRWVGRLPVPKMFEGEHFFRITDKPDGGVRFTQGERYAGLLEPAFRQAVDAINRDSMNAVNRALKGHLEAAG